MTKPLINVTNCHYFSRDIAAVSFNFIPFADLETSPHIWDILNGKQLKQLMSLGEVFHRGMFDTFSFVSGVVECAVCLMC